MDLQDVCVDRLSRLTPLNQQRMANNWNLYSALQLHQLLAAGSRIEQAAASQYTANDVYECIAEYLDAYTQQAFDESNAVTSYYLDPALHQKLVYMAKHGLSFEKGELP